ncbi:MAG: hypothetical protein EOP59_19960 [Sphingomonadales bacterium]|nr:MAG: hypothetical protein EOP59_19960 [Sphingomonadales bacterium]
MSPPEAPTPTHTIRARFTGRGASADGLLLDMVWTGWAVVAMPDAHRGTGLILERDEPVAPSALETLRERIGKIESGYGIVCEGWWVEEGSANRDDRD